jgi:hypothetical protein
VQPDRASTSALRLSRGLFGAGKTKFVPTVDPKGPEKDETDERQATSGLKHLFGR